MFGTRRYQSKTASAFGLLERVFHATVRSLRENHGHAVLGLIYNMLQTLIFIAAFFLLMTLMRQKSAPLRGDFLMFIMSGVFLFMVHVKAIGAVAGAAGSTSGMMKHAPMNTMISISSAALAALYIQMLTMVVILFFYDAFWVPVKVHDPIGALGMILMAWISGIGIGMILMAARPWNPRIIGVVSTVIMRANMIASGKMFVANQLGFLGLYIFGWNPLYHTIDQARGFVFENYSPKFTSLYYPIAFTFVLIVLGMMAEFFTRKAASASWGAGK